MSCISIQLWQFGALKRKLRFKIKVIKYQNLILNFFFLERFPVQSRIIMGIPQLNTNNLKFHKNDLKNGKATI